MLGSPGEEDDLVQDTYLRAFRSLPTYRAEAPITAWLLTIARRVCADHVRSRVRERRLVGVLAQEVDDAWLPSPAIRRWTLLDAIDPDRREAFVLTQVAGLSYDEAAVVLDCPVGTIRRESPGPGARSGTEVCAAEAVVAAHGPALPGVFVVELA